MKNIELLYNLYLDFLENKNSDKLDEFCRKNTNNIYHLEFGKGSTCAVGAKGLFLFVWQGIECSTFEILFHTENNKFKDYTFSGKYEPPTLEAESFLEGILKKTC